MAVEGEGAEAGEWDRTHRRLSRCAMLVMDTPSHYCKSIYFICVEEWSRYQSMPKVKNNHHRQLF